MQNWITEIGQPTIRDARMENRACVVERAFRQRSNW